MTDISHKSEDKAVILLTELRNVFWAGEIYLMNCAAARRTEVFGGDLENGVHRMTDFQLSDEEINSLIEYLKYINKTATTYRE